MNPKQKKFLWIAGIAVAVFYFAPTFINSARRAAYLRQQEAARMAKPPAQQSSPLPAAGDASSSTSFENLPGVWQGVGPLPGQGFCNLRLELRKNTQQPERFSGFPVLVCMPVMPGSVQRGATGLVLPQMSPLSAVLTGTGKDGSIVFSVDKVIGRTANGCALTSLSVTPFGTDQIAVEWQEGNCDTQQQPGQILLRRTGK